MGARGRENLFAYLMLGPDLLGLALFIFAPIVMAFVVSLHSWDALSPMSYIGLENYAQLLSDSDWWRSLGITVSYVLMYVAITYCASLALAVFLASMRKFQEFFRTLYFIPFAISTVVSGMIWLFMYNDKNGYLNAGIRALGLAPLRFLSNTSQALPSIAIATAWMSVGYYTIIFLTAIKDIPVSYYEAARLDGANAGQLFFRITLPLLREVNAFVLIITTIASFQVFDQVKIMTNGGPANATNVTVFYVYRQCFEFMKLGYSSSLAFVLFVVIFLVSIVQIRLTRADRGSSGE
jgi:multiple sugar transport system permease protein